MVAIVQVKDVNLEVCQRSGLTKHNWRNVDGDRGSGRWGGSSGQMEVTRNSQFPISLMIRVW